ncbi:hypothetical protein PGT21_050337 [Puccinia graminis f. sp. tritici]|uniref:Uncharacterized protein n=1 Tax=Puccinia graminis f. sp. tritici TaxID=56615 RepID=A0A5B0LN53_PUCGR|nr:hypothetical protein PGT21_050337 [Puccinia graminis f. sp. tritici]
MRLTPSSKIANQERTSVVSSGPISRTNRARWKRSVKSLPSQEQYVVGLSRGQELKHKTISHPPVKHPSNIRPTSHQENQMGRPKEIASKIISDGTAIPLDPSNQRIIRASFFYGPPHCLMAAIFPQTNYNRRTLVSQRLVQGL